MNKVTHFIDASSIYGSTPEQASELRNFIGGRLKVFNDYGRDLLPLSKDSEACLTMEQGSACFASGMFLYYPRCKILLILIKKLPCFLTVFTGVC